MKYTLSLMVALAISIFTAAKDRNETGKIIVNGYGADVGKNLVDNSILPCLQFGLPYNILSMQYDDRRHEIIILGGDGRPDSRGCLGVFDMRAAAFKWVIEVRGNEAVPCRNSIIVGAKYSTFCYSRETGNLEWRTEGVKVRYADTLNEIGISGLGKGVDLKTGKIIWKRDQGSNDYLSNFMQLNETTVAAISNGLHVFNTQAGNGVRAWGKTEAPDNTNGVVAAAVLGGLVGALIVASLTSDMRYKTTQPSQLCIGDGRMWFAMRNAMVCVDYNSYRELWRTKLPESKASNGSLYDMGDKLLWVNEGMGSDGEGKKKPVGYSYMMAVDKASGQMIYEQDLSKYGALRDKKLNGDTLSFVYSRTICQVSAKDGHEISKKKNTDIETFYEYFMDTSQVYEIYPDRKCVRFSATQANAGQVIADNEGGAVVLDADHNYKGKIERKKLGTAVDKEGQLQLIDYGKGLYVERNGEIVGVIDTKKPGLLLGGRYYYVEEDKMSIVDLKGLMQN